MEAAKEAVQSHLSKSGRHDTTLHEKTAPAVQNETISRSQHESHTAAVDREVHQDHFHTSEQPINHSEVLPEQHHHRAIPIEHRSFEHGDDNKLKRGLEDERKKYQNTQTRVEGEKTREMNPVVAGEHVHHHVHETIQPVVNKQTVEPHVVHTTVPIHEVHHNKANHHAATSLEPMSMDDFKKQGGALGGREEKTTFLDGEPGKFGGHHIRDNCATGDNIDDGSRNVESKRLGNDSHIAPSTSDKYANGAAGAATAGSAARSGDKTGTDGRLPGSSHNTSSHSPTQSTASTTSHKKPSLLDRINPKKDADGDGKAGFMK